MRNVKRSACIAVVVLALASLSNGKAQAKSPSIPPTSDPSAIQYCLNSQGMNGQPQVVKGVKVVAVCVENYQYVPGDANVLPCPGYIDGTPSDTCVSPATVAAPPLRIQRGMRLLFVVPDPNMHTLTSVNCPNIFADPPSPDPVGAFNLAIGTVEEVLFGPDDIKTGRGRCWFDTYPTNGGTKHPKPGVGDLQGPGYESVDTSGLPPGTYHFYCQVHAFMQGSLVVHR
jgi:hypothetical protein